MKFAVSGFAYNYNTSKVFHTAMFINSDSEGEAFMQAMKILKELKPDTEGWSQYDVVIIGDGRP